MANLPPGWTLSEPEDDHGPHVLSRDGTPVAALRLRVSQQFRDAVSGRWEWRGLPGAAEMAPWTEDGFHDFDDAVEAAIERLTQTRLWTIADIAEHLGASSTGSARRTLSRWGVTAVARQPGRGGQNLFDPQQVRDAQAERPGRGKRTDLKTAEEI